MWSLYFCKAVWEMNNEKWWFPCSWDISIKNDTWWNVKMLIKEEEIGQVWECKIALYSRLHLKALRISIILEMLLQHQMSYLRRNLILKILNLLADIWVPLDYRPASFPSYKGSAAHFSVRGTETLALGFSTIHIQAAKPRQGQRPCPLFSGAMHFPCQLSSPAYHLPTMSHVLYLAGHWGRL